MEGRGMIDGVLVVPLRKIADERGTVMHMLRCDAPHFEKFGEIYFATAYPGVIKGWHVHKRMTLNYCVVSGMVKLVLYDARPDSPTKGELQELFIGDLNYVLVRIPPGIWHGWKCISEHEAILANCPTEQHDPSEIERMSPFSNEIPYDWSLKHG
jgi:dTDP-4-dehydrorhamnose 3,5-epimerase